MAWYEKSVTVSGTANKEFFQCRVTSVTMNGAADFRLAHCSVGMNFMKWLRVGLCLAVVLLLTRCDGMTHVEGIVEEEGGKPLAGVVVSLELHDDEGVSVRTRSVTTGEDGRYVVGFTHAPFRVPLSIKADKSGYAPFEKRFESTDHVRNLNIVMQRVKQN